MLIISFPPTLLPCTICSLLSMPFDWFLLGLDTCLIRRDLKLRSDANVTLFLHPFVSVNISETDTGKNNGIHLSSKVTICIYVRDLALVCVLYFSLCVTSHVTLCPWPVWGFGGFVCFCFPPSPLVIFLNVVHCKSFGDSSTFSHRASDFLLQHWIIRVSEFYFCFCGENSFFHFL